MPNDLIRDTVVAVQNAQLVALTQGRLIGKQEAEAKIKQLRDALCELLDQVEGLEDYSLSRDMEPYKAQACWEDAIDRATKTLKETA